MIASADVRHRDQRGHCRLFVPKVPGLQQGHGLGRTLYQLRPPAGISSATLPEGASPWPVCRARAGVAPATRFHQVGDEDSHDVSIHGHLDGTALLEPDAAGPARKKRQRNGDGASSAVFRDAQQHLRYLFFKIMLTFRNVPKQVPLSASDVMSAPLQFVGLCCSKFVPRRASLQPRTDRETMPSRKHYSACRGLTILKLVPGHITTENGRDVLQGRETISKRSGLAASGLESLPSRIYLESKRSFASDYLGTGTAAPWPGRFTSCRFC